jgi:hypothetical protein
MTATSASDLTPPVEYYFYASNGNHRYWNTSRAYVDSAALPNTVQSYRVQARDSASTPNVGGWSTTESTTTPIETPQALGFGTITDSSIQLVAVGTYTNLTVGYSGLYFQALTSGGAADVNAWVQTTTDTATNLNPNTEYAYRFRARNQLNIATTYSATASAYTHAAVPAAPALSNPTTDTMQLDVLGGSNPAGTQFAVRCAATTDGVWQGKYVSSAGTATSSPVWRTDAEWGTVTLTGLSADTQYCFHVRARNAEQVETAFSGQSCEQTQGGPSLCPGDANCDDAINWRDIDFFVAAMNDNVAAWESMFTPAAPTCSFANNDANEDGNVNWRDIDPFVSLMNTACP